MVLFGRGRPRKEEPGPKSPEELKEETLTQDGVIITPEYFEPKPGENPHNKTAEYLGFIAREMLRLNSMLEAVIVNQSQASQERELTPEERRHQELIARRDLLEKEISEMRRAK